MSRIDRNDSQPVYDTAASGQANTAGKGSTADTKGWSRSSTAEYRGRRFSTSRTGRPQPGYEGPAEDDGDMTEEENASQSVHTRSLRRRPTAINRHHGGASAGDDEDEEDGFPVALRPRSRPASATGEQHEGGGGGQEGHDGDGDDAASRSATFKVKPPPAHFLAKTACWQPGPGVISEADPIGDNPQVRLEAIERALFETLTGLAEQVTRDRRAPVHAQVLHAQLGMQHLQQDLGVLPGDVFERLAAWSVARTGVRSTTQASARVTEGACYAGPQKPDSRAQRLHLLLPLVALSWQRPSTASQRREAVRTLEALLASHLSRPVDT